MGILDRVFGRKREPEKSAPEVRRDERSGTPSPPPDRDRYTESEGDRNLERISLEEAKRRRRDDGDLSYVDLSGMDLRSLFLSGANLTGSNLSGANLQGMGLDQAILVDADLSNTNLRGAFLQTADLRGANLDGADTTGAFV